MWWVRGGGGWLLWLLEGKTVMFKAICCMMIDTLVLLFVCTIEVVG